MRRESLVSPLRVLLLVLPLGCGSEGAPSDAATGLDATTSRDATTTQDAAHDDGGEDATTVEDAASDAGDTSDAGDSSDAGDAGGDGCEPGHYDLNGSAVDACEFVLDDDAIYVSGSDAALGP